MLTKEKALDLLTAAFGLGVCMQKHDPEVARVFLNHRRILAKILYDYGKENVDLDTITIGEMTKAFEKEIETH